MKRFRIRLAGDTIAAVLALVVLATIVLLHDAGSPATDTYSSTDYQSGGYAAWYALLQHEGVPLERFEQRTVELDRTTATLITAPPAAPLVEREAPEAAALDAWVRAGGRLVRTGTAASPRTFAFGVGIAGRASRQRDSDGPFTGAFAGSVRSLANVGFRRLPVPRPARGEHFEVLLADDLGIIAFRETRGLGDEIRVSNPHLFSNDAIAHADNARLAYLLARPRRAGGLVAFDEAIHGALTDRTWWNVLPIPVRVALGGVLLAALVAIVGGALRLGPAVDARAKREPTSGEFIAAVAGLYERTHARAHAIAALTGESTAMRPTDRDVIAAATRAHSQRTENP